MQFNGLKNKKRSAWGIFAVLMGAATLAHAGHTNTVLTTDLWGGEQVSSDATDERILGDPNGKGEAYVFGIDGDPETLCYVLTVDKIQLVPVGEGMAAHIHMGARGENGPVVAKLAGPEDGNAADCLSEYEAGDKFNGSAPGIVQMILENPEMFYINVHNPEYPAGAIRGQLRYQDPHDH